MCVCSVRESPREIIILIGKYLDGEMRKQGTQIKQSPSIASFRELRRLSSKNSKIARKQEPECVCGG